MFRKARLRRESADARGFRTRGREVTRLESFSDGVFAFALTLLVVSLEVPKSVGELFETMRGFVAFGVCFAILAGIWNEHYVFCRRFGLENGLVRFLTCILLFIVLLYVYPLKFLFNLFVNGMIMRGVRGQLTLADGRTLFVIYGLGFTAIYIALSVLYLQAWRHRKELSLSPLEVLGTRWEIYGFLYEAAVGVLSIFMALSLPGRWINWAGFIYFALFPILTVHGFLRRRLSAYLSAASTASTAESSSEPGTELPPPSALLS